jgi:hypothetical protein
MTLNGFPTGSYPYTCNFGSGGDQTFTLNKTSDPETFDNGRTCFDTIVGDTIWVTIGSVTSNVLTVGSSAPPPPSEPVFTVMNTSETPPDGIYFRNSPHWADTNRIFGLGVFANEQVQLHCYAFGDAIGSFNNALWYYATNVTRPTVNGQPDVGWLNAHYINDGLLANQIDAGVPAC